MTSGHSQHNQTNLVLVLLLFELVQYQVSLKAGPKKRLKKSPAKFNPKLPCHFIFMLLFRKYFIKLN